MHHEEVSMECLCSRIAAIVILGLSLLDVYQARQSIAFLVLGPYADIGQADSGWKGGPAMIPAVRLAVDRINNRTDTLPGYMIHLLEGDSGCQNEPKAAYSFVSNIFHDATEHSPHVVGVIGPGCSEAALLLGNIGAKPSISIIQISPSATSPLLTDIKKYPNTFRTLSTALQHVRAIIALMAKTKWKSIAVLHDVSRVYFRSIAEHVLDKYSSNVGFHSEIRNTYYPLGSIEARFKIVVLLSGDQLAREVICLAYHHQPQIIYPVYQWILIEKRKDQFIKNVQFTYNKKLYNCSEATMAKAIEGSIFTSYNILNWEDKLQSTDVDLSLDEFLKLYKVYRETHLNELDELRRQYEPGDEYAVSYYDATWALAFALHASLDQLLKEASVSLGDYTHGYPQATAIIRQNLGEVRFEGLLGKVEFSNATQDGNTPIDLYQCLGGENVSIGVYDGKDLDIFPNKSKLVLDNFYQRVVSVHPAATTAVILLAIILVVYTVSLHIIFIVLRHHKSVKADSFTISHFMFSGCYLILIRVLLLAVEFSRGWETESVADSYTRNVVLGVICNINEWLNSIGIALIMGTLCGKLWRVYRLFNYFYTKRFLVSDFTLISFTLSVVSVNLLFLVTWTSFDPLLADFHQENIEYNGKDEPIILMRVYCRCEHYSIWFSLAYLLNFIVVICVVILSSLNRHINRKHFQMSKSVNLMVYLIALSCSIGVGLAFVLESLNIHYTYLLWQFSLLSIVSLVCVFIFSRPAFTAIKPMQTY